MSPRRDERITQAVARSLAKIQHAVADRERVETRVRKTVASARGAGSTWTEIGSALGMTQQGAQKRYDSGRST